MSDNIVVENVELDTAINEYKDKKRDVIKSFVGGCIELWAVLEKHRKILKPKWLWMQYCEEIHLHIAQANQQIRLYEYSLDKTKKELLERVITNWKKLNLFLALEDDEKEKILSSETLDEFTSSEDFKKEITSLTVSEELEVEDEIEDVVIEKVEDMMDWQNPMLDNPSFTAKQIQSTEKMSKATIPILEGILYIQKGRELVANRTRLNEKDKTKVRERLLTQIDELSEIVANL